MGSLSLQTGLLVVAKRLDKGSTWPMSNNPKNQFFTAGPNDTFFSNEDYLLRAGPWMSPWMSPLCFPSLGC